MLIATTKLSRNQNLKTASTSSSITPIKYFSLSLIDYSKQTDMEKYNTWNMYREEIQKEQKEYMLWAENQILNAKQSNQVELSPEARNFAEAHIQQKLQNIKKLPQHYFPVFRLPDSMLRLVAMSNEQQINPPQYEMRPESQLLELVSYLWFF